MRALVLSGGGAKGAYQVGVLQKVMRDEQRDYEILCGISVGSLNIAAISHEPFGQPTDAYERLENFWSRISTDQVYRKWSGWPMSVLWKNSVYDTAPLRKLVLDNCDQAKIRASGRKLRIGAVSWETGKYAEATETADNLAWWVLASSSFPVMFSPIRIGNDVWTDGGARNITPLASAIQMGATEIDVILASNPDVVGSRWSTDGKYAVQDYLFRFIGLLLDEIMRGDLKVVGYNNQYAQPRPEYAGVKIRLMQPRGSMPYDSLDFSQKAVQEMIALGYKEAYEENF